MRSFVQIIIGLALVGCSPADVKNDLSAGTSGAGTDAGGISSGGDGGSVDSGTGVSVAAACSDHAYQRCTYLEKCSSTYLQTRYGSLAVCESLMSATCAAALGAPGSGATIATTQACDAILSTWACDDFINNQNQPAECATVPGTRPDGAPCAVSQQCASASCSVANGSACGTCGPAPEVGDSCAIFGCGTFVCSATPKTCVSYAERGATCGSNQPCALGLVCTGNACQPAVTSLGSNCTFEGPGCDIVSGLTCNAATSTCQTMKLVGPGTACGEVGSAATTQCIAGSCPRGVCVATPMVGEPCDIASGPTCVSGAHCIAATDGGTTGTCLTSNPDACP